MWSCWPHFTTASWSKSTSLPILELTGLPTLPSLLAVLAILEPPPSVPVSPSPLSFQDIPKIFPETVRTSDLGWISQSLLAMMAEVHSRLTIHWLRKRTSQMAMPITQQRRCACAPSMFRFCFGVQECSDDEEELNDMCYKKLDPQVGVCRMLTSLHGAETLKAVALLLWMRGQQM